MPLIRNFGRNVEFSPAQVYAPRNDGEVLDILRRHRGAPVRCMGGGHSWSGILRTAGVLLDLRHFDRVNVAQRGAEPRVRIDAGCTIGRAMEELEKLGLTLPTVGAIKKQTIAGAVSTGTHGSGKESLSHFVQEVRLATYDPVTREPAIVRLRGGDELLAARCALGGLGVILDVVLTAREIYRVEERVEKADAFTGAKEWPLQQAILVPWKWKWIVYQRRETKEPGSRLWALLIRAFLHLYIDHFQHLLLKGMLQLSRLAGGWLTRAFLRCTWIPCVRRIDKAEAVLTLGHDLYRHVEMEAFVPERNLVPAVESIRSLLELAADVPSMRAATLEPQVPKLKGIWTHHYPIAFRRILADDTLISMASGAEPWISISFFTYLPVNDAWREFAKATARLLIAKHDARLHWGKYFPVPFRRAALSYPRFAQFEAVRNRYDRDKWFWNTNLRPRGRR